VFVSIEWKEEAINIMNTMDDVNKKKMSDALLLVQAALNKAAESGTFKLKEAASLNHIMDQFDAVVISGSDVSNRSVNDWNSYLEFTTSALNRAAKKGAYTMDEAFYIKTAMITINGIVNGS